MVAFTSVEDCATTLPEQEDGRDYNNVVNGLALAALQAVSKTHNEGLILTDAAGEIVSMNRTAELALGCSAGHLVGKRCRRFLRCLDGNHLDQHRLSCNSAGVVTNGEVVRRVMRSVNEGRLAVSARSSTLFDEEGVRIGSLCTFITGHRDGLIDNAAAEFLTNVSHELRTPLSSLAVSIELLARSYRDMPKQHVERVLQITHNNMLQLNSLVENLLSASSLQLGCFQIQPRLSNLFEIVEEAAAYIEPILEKKRQRLRKELPDRLPSVTVDPRRIAQVIINLLSNASKYGPASDEILLSANRSGRYIVVSVRENGPGISKAEQRNIFGRFYRSRDSSLEGTPGVGLGLAIVKSIVTAHGGNVGVRSRAGHGATFWFSIPVGEDANELSDVQGGQL